MLNFSIQIFNFISQERKTALSHLICIIGIERETTNFKSSKKVFWVTMKKKKTKKETLHLFKRKSITSKSNNFEIITFHMHKNWSAYFGESCNLQCSMNGKTSKKGSETADKRKKRKQETGRYLMQTTSRSGKAAMLRVQVTSTEGLRWQW